MACKYFDVKGKCIVFVKATGDNKDYLDGQIVSVLDPVQAVSICPELKHVSIKEFPVSELELAHFMVFLRPIEEMGAIADLCVENSSLMGVSTDRVKIDLKAVATDCDKAEATIKADYADAAKVVDPIDLKAEYLPIVRSVVVEERK